MYNERIYAIVQSASVVAKVEKLVFERGLVYFTLEEGGTYFLNGSPYIIPRGYRAIEVIGENSNQLQFFQSERPTSPTGGKEKK